MIKLNKGPEPAVLISNSVNWTDALMTKLAHNEKPTDAERNRYRHPEVKAALLEETESKCAYCESRLLHIHHGDVEHIFPKSLDPVQSFSWENLTLACEKCNQNKSNRDPFFEFIIDPYDVDPEEHLFFLGGLIFSRPTLLGRSTRAILDLHRPELVEMRNDRAEKIVAIYDQILDASLPLPVRQAIYDNLKEREAGPSAPYAAMARCIIRDMASELPDGMVH